MGRLVQAKGIRLGIQNNWKFGSSFDLNCSYNKLELQKYLVNICNSFYLKNSVSKVLLILFDEAIVKVSKDVIEVDIHLYDADYIDELPNVDEELFNNRLILLESMIINFVSTLYQKPCKINFVYLDNGKFTANLIIQYIEVKFLQGFNLGEITGSLQRSLKDVRGLQGYRIDLSGRFTRKQRASHYSFKAGSVPFSKLSSNIDYSEGHVILKYGKCGLKVWLNYGVN